MRNLPISLALTALFFAAAACTNGNGTTPAATGAAKPGDSTSPMKSGTMSHGTGFTVAMVDNKKDPSCGMPVTAGIGDTVHYAGKVIGFCSKECKDDFLKDPVAGLKKTEFKK